MARFEYKVLGAGSVEVTDGTGTRHVTLDRKPVSVTDLQLVLDTLGDEGWDVVTLDFPYVFKRSWPVPPLNRG